MKKAETLLIGILLIAVVTITGGAVWYHSYAQRAENNHIYPESKYGNFLAAQHAIYVNDFENNMRYDTGDIGLYSPTFIAISKSNVLGFHEIVNEVLDNYYSELTETEKETLKNSYLEVIDSMNSSEN